MDAFQVQRSLQNTLEANVADLEQGLAGLRSEVNRADQALKRSLERPAGSGGGSHAISDLEKRLRDVERLATECAQAIELILQKELVLEMKIDTRPAEHDSFQISAKGSNPG